MPRQSAFAGSTDKYVCSLFSFVEGIGIRGMSTEELIPYQKQIGAITAKLHLHAMLMERRQFSATVSLGHRGYVW